MFPLGLIDHIDILKDGASSIYGSDAVGGVVNVWLIHKFRGLEVYTSYGNTNLGASNDQGEELAYLLGGAGDDKTDIVVYAELYRSRRHFRLATATFLPTRTLTRFGGFDNRSATCRACRRLRLPAEFEWRQTLTPTPHAFPKCSRRPAIRVDLQSVGGAARF